MAETTNAARVRASIVGAIAHRATAYVEGRGLVDITAAAESVYDRVVAPIDAERVGLREELRRTQNMLLDSINHAADLSKRLDRARDQSIEVDRLAAELVRAEQRRVATPKVVAEQVQEVTAFVYDEIEGDWFNDLDDQARANWLRVFTSAFRRAGIPVDGGNHG